mgnify:CR=1 FL=1
MAANEKFPNDSEQRDDSPDSWRAIVERLDHLRARMAGNGSGFVKRQYELALADFSEACSARSRALGGADNGGF